MNEQPTSLPAPAPLALERSAQLLAQLRAALHAGGGWLPFDAYMQQALYAPGLGYYTGQAGQFGDFGQRGDLGGVGPALKAVRQDAVALHSPSTASPRRSVPPSRMRAHKPPIPRIAL